MDPNLPNLGKSSTWNGSKKITNPTCKIVDLVEHELEGLGGRELVLVILLLLRQKIFRQPAEKRNIFYTPYSFHPYLRATAMGLKNYRTVSKLIFFNLLGTVPVPRVPYNLSIRDGKEQHTVLKGTVPPDFY